MKQSIRWPPPSRRQCLVALCGFVLLAALSSTVHAAGEQEDQAPSSSAEAQLSALAFLAGTWAGEMWGGEFVAHYSEPFSEQLLGYSELWRNGEVAFYEFERFAVQDGEVVYSPFPGGKKAVPLRLASLDEEGAKAVFENPNKDYPTRVVFHRKAGNQLDIVLSDPHNDSDKVERFELRHRP